MEKFYYLDNMVLWLILAVLLFGSAAVLDAIGLVFWLVVLIVVIILVLIGFGAISNWEPGAKEKYKQERQHENELQKQYEKENSNPYKKHWLGFYYREVKRDPETGKEIDPDTGELIDE